MTTTQSQERFTLPAFASHPVLDFPDYGESFNITAVSKSLIDTVRNLEAAWVLGNIHYLTYRGWGIVFK